MSGGRQKGNITFNIVEIAGTGALMVVTQQSTGQSKEYPLSEDDLHRLQKEVQENIIHCIKKKARETSRLDNIRRVGI